jgi:hypothetical protein
MLPSAAWGNVHGATGLLQRDSPERLPQRAHRLQTPLRLV